MGRNSGIIFGQVTNNGSSVKGAVVNLNWIKGDLSQNGVRALSPNENENYLHSAETNEAGKYVIPFAWDGTQIAETLQGRLTISILGWAEAGAKNVHAPGFLCLDLKSLISQGYPTFNEPVPEAFDVAKDFIAAYRGLLTVAPHYKIVLSTEVWSILARGNIDIGAPLNLN